MSVFWLLNFAELSNYLHVASTTHRDITVGPVHQTAYYIFSLFVLFCSEDFKSAFPGEGGTLDIFGWARAAGTLVPLTYTRPCSAAVSDPILDQMWKIPTLIQTSFYQIERFR